MKPGQPIIDAIGQSPHCSKLFIQKTLESKINKSTTTHSKLCKELCAKGIKEI